MDLVVQGKVAVAPGASRGIGLAIVQALVGEGVHVVAGSRHSSPELDGLAAGGAVTTVDTDLSQPGGPEALVQAAGDHLDIVVNNVGAVTLRLGGFLTITDDEW